jgi:hypothetical protein
LLDSTGDRPGWALGEVKLSTRRCLHVATNTLDAVVRRTIETTMIYRTSVALWARHRSNPFNYYLLCRRVAW